MQKTPREKELEILLRQFIALYVTASGTMVMGAPYKLIQQAEKLLRD